VSVETEFVADGDAGSPFTGINGQEPSGLRLRLVS
jgi:hypothetical protein